MKLCVIGDIHGRKSLLEKVVRAYPDYQYIILGDIIHHKWFFRRSQRVSPMRVIEFIMELGDRAITIMGNNEKYVLEKFCSPLESIRKSEARFTMKVLRDLDTSKRIEVMRFLVNMPPSLEIGKYRFSHAYYKDPNEHLFGPGYYWFTPEYESIHTLDPNYEYFFGHYGKPYFRKNIRVLDCTELDAVGVWLTDTSEFKVFT
jgi:hypothetical protein